MLNFKNKKTKKVNSLTQNYLDNRQRSQEVTISPIAMMTVGSLVLIACLMPELSLAANLEDQLNKVKTVANGQFKTIGITAATIGGAIWSIVKGNLKLTGIIIAIALALSLQLQWIEGGMEL
ncbi:MAG: hypothetical protein P8P83_04865 [Rickettsiaceae bacterium]|nr:hypothetical protein [Rickettsiaceae bacterium]